MPSEKSLRSAQRKYQRNRPIKSSLRSVISHAKADLDSKDIAKAEEAVGKAQIALDRAAQKGVIHRNNAARHKSRLAQKLNSAKANKG